jgi:hypothetical protein
LYGKSKSPLGCAIIVSNERQDAGAQLLHRAATESGKQATHEEREPDLNLVEPGAMPWGVDEANAMAGIGEKGSARVHAGLMAAFASSRPVPPRCHTAQPPDAPAFPIDGC